MIFFLAIFFLVNVAHGQPTRPPVFSGATDPATCNPANSYFFRNTTSGVTKYCSATNTWSIVGGGGAPSGPAGGKLSGTYPNPGVNLAVGDIPTLNQNTTGNSATATALAVNGANCSAGNAPLGVDASGASESCFRVPQQFFGTAAPGSVTGNLPGDLYSDTTNHHDYWCNATSGTAAPACTSVASGAWTQLDGGGGGTSPGAPDGSMQYRVNSTIFGGSGASWLGTFVGQTFFTGTSGGPNATFGGSYTDTANPQAVFSVVLTTAGTPSKFKWNKCTLTMCTAQSSEITLLLTPIALSDGVTVTFDAVNGGTMTNEWGVYTGVLRLTNLSFPLVLQTNLNTQGYIPFLDGNGNVLFLPSTQGVLVNDGAVSWTDGFTGTCTILGLTSITVSHGLITSCN